MKIVALLPFKNESWVLPSYIASITKVADVIIALDDNSSDNGASLLQKAGATVISYDSSHEEVVNMGRRRQILLDAGRAIQGTHFIWLDADEVFSADFIPKARTIIASLKPGQSLTMRWVHMWKNATEFINDTRSPFGYIWKDFIYADNQTDSFIEKFLSEPRTPGAHDQVVELPESAGVVIHWQFLPFDTNQYKQALYRCYELLEGSRSARRINNTYAITLDNPTFTLQSMPKLWQDGILVPSEDTQKKKHYADQLDILFNKYGIVFFEPLQIWHIASLRKKFITSLNREPISKIFPGWLITLNDIKNKLRYG